MKLRVIENYYSQLNIRMLDFVLFVMSCMFDHYLNCQVHERKDAGATRKMGEYSCQYTVYIVFVTNIFRYCFAQRCDAIRMQLIFVGLLVCSLFDIPCVNYIFI